MNLYSERQLTQADKFSEWNVNELVISCNFLEKFYSLKIVETFYFTSKLHKKLFLLYKKLVKTKIFYHCNFSDWNIQYFET